uniref:Uncharacterized protein n=1 Tax=Macrostomum lignano TaxID=282301 RepID=A0A1I8F9J9_9PLAT
LLAQPLYLIAMPPEWNLPSMPTSWLATVRSSHRWRCYPKHYAALRQDRLSRDAFAKHCLNPTLLLERQIKPLPHTVYCDGLTASLRRMLNAEICYALARDTQLQQLPPEHESHHLRPELTASPRSRAGFRIRLKNVAFVLQVKRVSRRQKRRHSSDVLFRRQQPAAPAALWRQPGTIRSQKDFSMMGSCIARRHLILRDRSSPSGQQRDSDSSAGHTKNPRVRRRSRAGEISATSAGCCRLPTQRVLSALLSQLNGADFQTSTSLGRRGGSRATRSERTAAEEVIMIDGGATARPVASDSTAAASVTEKAPAATAGHPCLPTGRSSRRQRRIEITILGSTRLRLRLNLTTKTTRSLESAC